MPSQQINNPAGVWGSSSTSAQGFCTEHVAAVTLAYGVPVMLSTTNNQVVTADNTQKVIGITVESASSGAPVLVCIEGPVAGAVKSVVASITQFDAVGVSATTAGTLVRVTAATAITQVKDTGLVIGIAMATATTGDTTVDVYVSKF